MDTQLIAALVGLLTATTLLVKVWTDIAKIKRDRMETKDARNKDSLALHDAVLKLQFETTTLKDNQTLHSDKIDDLNRQSASLNTALAQVLVKLDNVIDTLKELKEGAK